MFSIFKDTTGISDYEQMEKNPDYFKKNKNKEIHIISMPPQEYLKIVQKGFEQRIDYEYNFIPSDISIKRIQKMIDNNEKLDMPFITEEYSSGFFKEDEEKWYFSQEGRHRAFTAYKLGIKKINVAYVISCDMESKIGMEKYVPISEEVIKRNKQQQKWKKKSISKIKKVFGKNIDFKLENKRYLDNRLGGFVKNSTYEEDTPIIVINSFFERNIIDNNMLEQINFIAEDTIFHEYGHLLYELAQDTSLMDKIKDYFSKVSNEDFKEFLLSNELVPEYEFYDEDLEYYQEDFLDNYIEESFSENFVSFLRLKLSEKDYFNNCRNEETLKSINDHLDFFYSIFENLKKINNDFSEEQQSIQKKEVVQLSKI